MPINGVSQGTASLPFNAATFNLNFNTTTDQFVVGGDSNGPAGQLWNFALPPPTSVGFGSGSGVQAVSVNGMLFGLINVADSTLSATLVHPAVPLPGTLPLFATGHGALGLLGWRRKRKAAA